MAHPTLAGVFVEEKGLVAHRAARAQVQRPRQSLLPIFLHVSGEEAGVPFLLLCHPTSNLLWTVCMCVQTHGTQSRTPVYNSS